MSTVSAPRPTRHSHRRVHVFRRPIMPGEGFAFTNFLYRGMRERSHAQSHARAHPKGIACGSVRWYLPHLSSLQQEGFNDGASTVLPAKLAGFRPPWFRPPGETLDAGDAVSPKWRNSKTTFFSAEEPPIVISSTRASHWCNKNI